MLTRAGWLVLLIGGLSVVAGRLFGLVELFLLGATAMTVVILAFVLVALRRLRLDVSRQIVPRRVPAGSPARVDLAVANRARSRTPVLRFADAVSGTRGANLLISPLAPGDSAQASYQLPTERRGVIEVGPLDIAVTDPFGLVRSNVSAAGRTKLVVYPPIDAISTRSLNSGVDPRHVDSARAGLNQRGDDFHGLRQYVVGDDLRRVHWPSTARHDQLMIRQDQMPRHGSTTILLDVAEAKMPAGALDVAVSIAASIVEATLLNGDRVRLIATDGTDSGMIHTRSEMEAVMEYLAVVQPLDRAPLDAAAQGVLASPGDSGLITITGELNEWDGNAINSLGPHVRSITSILIDRSVYDHEAPDSPAVADRRWLRITRSASFADQWTRAFGAA